MAQEADNYGLSERSMSRRPAGRSDNRKNIKAGRSLVLLLGGCGLSSIVGAESTADSL